MALIGILIGIGSNLLPILGSTIINFIAVILVNGYQILAENVSQFPLIPIPIFIFAAGYFVGTFAIKILALLPIPYLQPIAISLRGTL